MASPYYDLLYTAHLIKTFWHLIPFIWFLGENRYVSTRRKSVFAETYDPEEDDNGDEKVWGFTNRKVRSYYVYFTI